MMQTIKVAVTGACGKMGMEICKSIIKEPNLHLVAVFDVKNQGEDIGSIIGLEKTGVYVENNINNISEDIDVLVDFTNAQALLNIINHVISKKINVVIGTTGLTQNETDKINRIALENNVGIFLAPNFAIGAILMMRFAKEAAKYFSNVEIMEMHHNQKIDAPSGTALKTLEEISKVRKPLEQGIENEYEKISGARGGNYEGMRVHSIRLPGLVAHQEVIFGDPGQTLTIRHDSLSRECFMPGIILAIKKVVSWKGLVFGLENILD